MWKGKAAETFFFFHSIRRGQRGRRHFYFIFLFKYASAKFDLIRLHTQSCFVPLCALIWCVEGKKLTERPFQMFRHVCRESARSRLYNSYAAITQLAARQLPTDAIVPFLVFFLLLVVWNNSLFKVDDISAIIPIQRRFNTSIHMH